MLKNISGIRKEVEEEAFDFFDFNKPVKTKCEVDDRISSINKKYKKELLGKISCLILCSAMLVFVFTQLITTNKDLDLTVTPFGIVLIVIELLAVLLSFFVVGYYSSSHNYDLTYYRYKKDYYSPVDVDSPKMIAGISDIINNDKIAIINKAILAQGRSVTLAEHVMMWNIYKESDDFLSKRNCVYELGLAKAKQTTKQ